MSKPKNNGGIFVIDICDPQTKEIIIPSMDRRYANGVRHAVRSFMKEFAWRSNWLVKATPTFSSSKTVRTQKRRGDSSRL